MKALQQGYLDVVSGQEPHAEMAMGFETLESLDKWPTEFLRRIYGGGDSSDAHVMSFLCRRRMEALLQHGLVLHTDFSGKGSVEMAFRILDIAGKEPSGLICFSRCLSALCGGSLDLSCCKGFRIAHICEVDCSGCTQRLRHTFY